MAGPCHSYVHIRGRTGGWMDAWCPHQMKIGSKQETMQESVSDICDIIHCMKKLPKLHCLDDACTFVRYVKEVAKE
jgi:hypothetical protein